MSNLIMTSNIQTKKLLKSEAFGIQGFLRAGYDDYMSARILINHDLLLQGAIMANTAVEKYFKAILLFAQDKSKYTHKTTELLKRISIVDAGLYTQIDKSFIADLEKSYMLRYIDSAPAGFRICLIKRKLLAELDSTVSLLIDRIKFRDSSGKGYQEDKYHIDFKERNVALYENNYLLNKIPKENFLIGIDDVYEFFVDKDLGFLEVFYKTNVSGVSDK
ncbi:HEPN domain-containing protein [Maribellus sp. CM-23]|uniref:HEPN domain-containing protein n=1 Tax=Maribellus sp. CM-23 TaxID=2781026 RepID=UPI001F457F17|nr:HEPN domain-containing protein [Maribellus sp. CM-23]MCE4563461.1 HEPN domain-containing protein [Maribellus sp. CM-23]